MQSGVGLSVGALALLARGLREQWGHWVGGERTLDEIRRWNVPRLHGPFDDAWRALQAAGLVEQRGDHWGLTAAGFRMAQQSQVLIAQRHRAAEVAAGPGGPADFPFRERIVNRDNVPWRVEGDFMDFAKKDAAGNADLGNELVNRMNLVLENPRRGDHYGGTVRKMHYHHNGRIRWRVDRRGDEETIVFLDVKSREDPNYSS